MDISNANFCRLMALVPSLARIRSTRIDLPLSAGLHVEVLYRYGTTTMLSLFQYREHAPGHSVADPSMIVAVYADTCAVDALVFQNNLGDRRVYFDDMAIAADVSIKPLMNQFLSDWLALILAEKTMAGAIDER